MATLTAHELNIPHIGPAPHRLRNLGIALAIVAFSTVAAVSLVFGRRTDAREAARLEAFTSAFATKCDPDAIGPTTAYLRRAYVKSDALQATVEQQYAALQAGADCRDVYQALRAGDFPMPTLK